MKTAVSSLMELVNELYAFSDGTAHGAPTRGEPPAGRTERPQTLAVLREAVDALVLMISPFAPHIAEELWERLGNEGSVFQGANWPAFDPDKARVREVAVAVQVNGKLRGSIQGPPGMSREDAESRARREDNVARYLDGASVRRVVYVPDRLLNFVIGSPE